MLEEVTILGNGPSRLGFEFNTDHPVWGCNAIYRDTDECDLVFAVDMPVQKEIVESGYYRDNKVAFADIDTYADIAMYLDINIHRYTDIKSINRSSILLRTGRYI